MKYDIDYDNKKESRKTHCKESECGEIKIKADNVFITINCKEKKEKKDDY